MNQVAQIRGLTESEAFVLYRLADRADNNGQNCFPGEELLAYECRIDVRTVRYVLASLIDLQVIEPADRYHTGPGRRKKYNLTFENALIHGITRRSKEARRPRKTRLTSVAEGKTETEETTSTGNHYPPAPPVEAEISQGIYINYRDLEEERDRIMRRIQQVEFAMRKQHPNRLDEEMLAIWAKNGAQYTARLDELNALLEGVRTT